MRARVWWIAGIVVAVFVTAGFFALTLSEKPKMPAGEQPADARGLDPLGGAATAPSVTDSPTVDFAVATKAVTQGPGKLAPAERSAWERYLASTQRTVQDNATALNTLVDLVLAALLSDDIPRLAEAWAPDESVDIEYIETLARTYPRIERGVFQSTVNVFSVETATVYFAYAQVEWTDGGIVSSHTIAIPVRFIGDRWYLSSIGLNTKGLTTVQAVQIQ